MNLRAETLKGIVLCLAATVLAGCSGGAGAGAGGTTNSDLTISGKVGGVSGSSIRTLDIGKLAVAITDLEVYAIALSNPPAISRVNLNSDGSFTMTLAGAKGAAVSMVFRDKTSLEEVGTVIFRDTSRKDMNGLPKDTTSVVLKDNVSLGDINISGGKVTVDVATIATAVDTTPVPVASAFDFGGHWKVAAYDGTLPTGYSTALNCDDPDDCQGPAVGMDLTMIRAAGKKFTPNSGTCDMNADPVVCPSTDGTVGTEDVFALSLWEGPPAGTGSGLAACGTKFGFTADEVRAGGHLHLAAAPTVGSTTVALDDYSWATASGFGGDSPNFTQPWQKTGATANWPIQDCTEVSKVGTDSQTYKLQSCKSNFDNGVFYNAYDQGTGGCIDSNGKPIVVDWSYIQSATPSCNQTTHPVAGMQTSSCTYTNQAPKSGATATTFICTHTGGTFSNANLTTPADWNTTGAYVSSVNLVNQNGACKDAGISTDANKLAAYRCYANAYHQNRPSGCTIDYRFDWSATTSANFILSSGHQKPKKNFLVDIATYSTDGNSFFVNSMQDEVGIVQEGSRSVVCRVERYTKINGKKISATRFLIDLTQGGRVLDIDNPACRAAAADTSSTRQNDVKYMVQGEKFLFYMDKQ